MCTHPKSASKTCHKIRNSVLFHSGYVTTSRQVLMHSVVMTSENKILCHLNAIYNLITCPLSDKISNVLIIKGLIVLRSHLTLLDFCRFWFHLANVKNPNLHKFTWVEYYHPVQNNPIVCINIIPLLIYVLQFEFTNFTI